MWFATDRGLSRFDGYTFTNYDTSDGLTDMVVFKFFPQSNGQVWCTTLNEKLFYKLSKSLMHVLKNFMNVLLERTLILLQPPTYPIIRIIAELLS